MTKIPGLSERCNNYVADILERFPQQTPFVLFGSRAKGNFRKGSDIDIAVKGECTKKSIAQLMSAFDESLLPYFVDVVDYHRINNPDLKDHIDRVGICLTPETLAD